MTMQNTGRKAKKKRELIYKPYLKGSWHGADAVKKGLKILTLYLVFLVMFLLVGMLLHFDSQFLTWIANMALVFVCGAFLYNEGATAGESQTALGEIAYGRRQDGKDVPEKELEKCFHPAKGWFSMLVGVLLPLTLAAIYAFIAKKQAYELQTLPEWVASFDRESEVMQPLSYYVTGRGLDAADYLRVVIRLWTLPCQRIAQTYGADAVLLADRLSPLLICLPALGYPLGYLTGPRSRAMIHGNISTSNRRRQRRKNKAMQARQKRSEKKNELI